jgi:hypothetical protein
MTGHRVRVLDWEHRGPVGVLTGVGSADSGRVDLEQ